MTEIRVYCVDSVELSEVIERRAPQLESPRLKPRTMFRFVEEGLKEAIWD